MKTLLVVWALISASLSSFAQGNFIFSTGPGRQVWDGFSDPTPRLTNTIYVAFLIGTGSSMVGSSVAESSPTNSQVPGGFATAWNAILNDPNYHFATNTSGNSLIVQQTSTTGTLNYNSGNPVTVLGTAADGGTISIFAIGWQVALGTNPFLAAASGGSVGWSAEFDYNYAAGPVPGPAGFAGNMNGLFAFGIVIPEPTSFALAGLGAASLLVFRHRHRR